jgi:transposase
MDSHKRSTQVERLEVIETGRRRRWSDDEKLRIVLESLQAPRAISSTARRHGISRSLLMTWRRSFRPEPTGPEAGQAGFVPAILIAETEPTVPATPASGRMVIIVGKDRRVIVDAGVDATALARAGKPAVGALFWRSEGNVSASRTAWLTFQGSNLHITD